MRFLGVFLLAVFLALGGVGYSHPIFSAANHRALQSLVNPNTGLPIFPPYATDPDCTLPEMDGSFWYSLVFDSPMVCIDGVGTVWGTGGGPGGGITSLGGQTGATQTFGAGTSGMAPSIVSSGNIHTLNVPMASTAGVTRGAISKTEYDSFVAKVSQTAFDNHLNDPTDAHDASAISVVPFGTIAATQVQAALEEIFSEAAGTDNQTAAEVPVTPFGSIAAVDVQAALEEVFNEAPGFEDVRADADAAATGNVTVANPGTDTFDGVTLTTGKTLALGLQTNRTQNGLYIFDTSSTALVRRADANENSEFANSFGFTVLPGGVAHGNTFWEFKWLSAVTLGTTDLSFIQTGIGPNVERTTRKGVASGYPPLGSDVKVPPAYLSSYAEHTALSASSQITVTKLITGVQGSGAVALTSPTPITGMVANQIALIVGISDTNTVTFSPATNLVLCGDQTSVTVAPSQESMWVRKDPTGDIVRRIDCSRFPDISKMIPADETSKVFIHDPADETTGIEIFVEAGIAKVVAICSGVPCANYTVSLGATGEFCIKDDGGVDLFCVDNTTGDTTVEGDLTIVGAVHGLAHAVSVTVPDPTTGLSGVYKFEWPVGVTVTEIQCSTDTGTVDVNMVERARATPNSGGTNTLTASLQCDNNGAVTTTFADAVIAGSVPYALLITATATSPTVVNVHIKAVRN